MCVLFVVVIVVTFCCAYPALNTFRTPSSEGYNGVLHLWQIDSFEGGKGSRASFLNRVAARYEQKSGMLLLITTHTRESAAAAIADGNIPDLISYGSGFEAVANIVLPYPQREFAAAKLGGHTVAFPWCRGVYLLFSLEEDFSTVEVGNTVVSSGIGNYSSVAAYYGGLRGELNVERSTQAYVSLLNGKYRYMVGTQRDVFRLRTRGVSFYIQPIDEYSDLMQYISVCTQDPKKYNAAVEYLEFLFSEEIQRLLTEIGMMSIQYKIYEEDAVLAEVERIPQRTLYAFLSADSSVAFLQCAKDALLGDKIGAKKMENYLVETL